MANAKLGEGRRVRGKDLFTLFTGLWGHEEFEACDHRLIKINFGSVSADYQEGQAGVVLFDAKKFGLVTNQNGRHRDMRSDNFQCPPFVFDPKTRPRLRLLYRNMLKEIKNAGAKKLFNGRISWNILKFTTVGPAGDRCYWERENIGEKREPVWVPLLTKLNKVKTVDVPIKEQAAAVGTNFFGGVCELEKHIIYGLKCAGI
jgi:hypothetical protein